MVHFVGAGCGASDLITVRGAKLLSEADLIIYTGSLIHPDLLRYATKDCVCMNSAQMTLEEVVYAMAEAEGEGKRVVRLHTGDPSLYGAIQEQFDALDQLGIDYDICPGVSSLFGAAAALKLEYTIPEVSQTLIITRLEGRTPVPEKETLHKLASHGASMALFLSAGMVERVQEELLSGGYTEDMAAAIIYRATWPDELAIRCTVGTLTEAAQKHAIKQHALIIVGDCCRPKATQSRLYAADFETGLRKAKT